MAGVTLEVIPTRSVVMIATRLPCSSFRMSAFAQSSPSADVNGLVLLAYPDNTTGMSGVILIFAVPANQEPCKVTAEVRQHRISKAPIRRLNESVSNRILRNAESGFMTEFGCG